MKSISICFRFVFFFGISTYQCLTAYPSNICNLEIGESIVYESNVDITVTKAYFRPVSSGKKAEEGTSFLMVDVLIDNQKDDIFIFSSAFVSCRNKEGDVLRSVFLSDVNTVSGPVLPGDKMKSTIAFIANTSDDDIKVYLEIGLSVAAWCIGDAEIYGSAFSDKRRIDNALFDKLIISFLFCPTVISLGENNYRTSITNIFSSFPEWPFPVSIETFSELLRIEWTNSLAQETNRLFPLLSWKQPIQPNEKQMYKDLFILYEQAAAFYRTAYNGVSPIEYLHLLFRVIIESCVTGYAENEDIRTLGIDGYNSVIRILESPPLRAVRKKVKEIQGNAVYDKAYLLRLGVKMYMD